MEKCILTLTSQDMHLLAPDTPCKEDISSLPNTVASVLERLRLYEDARHQKHLEQLDRVAKLVQEIVSAGQGGAPSITMSFGGREPSITPVRAVRGAIESFGDCEFTLDQLCARVAELFANECFSRTVISRRLYDLRQGQQPFVVGVRSSDALNSVGGSMKRHRYRRRKSSGLPSPI